MNLFRRNSNQGEPLAEPVRPLAAFDAGWHEVITKYAPKDESARPRLRFAVTQESAAWVDEQVVPYNCDNIPGNVYSMALLMGSFCLYAGWQHRNPYMRTPGGQATNLPLMSEYVPGPSDRQIAVAAIPPIWSTHHWVHLEVGGISPGDLVHAGLHVLGALTLMPQGSSLAVREGSDISSIKPPFAIAGVKPYPHDIAFSFLPPAAE